MNLRRVVAILTVFAALVAGAAILVWKRSPGAKAQPPAPAATQVTEEISVPAVLHATSVTLIGVPVEGKIQSFEVEVGAEVFEGQLLARIRSESLEGAMEAVEIDLERAETRVKNLETLLTSARLEASRASADAARLRNDLDRASKYYERQKMMIEQGATPRRTFEKAEADFRAVEAESKNFDAVAQASEDRISSLSRELDAARKQLERKAEDLEATKAQIGSGDIVSPVNGILVGRAGQAGDPVHPSTTDLLQVATDLSSLQAVAEVSPEFAGRVKPGQGVTLVIAELGGETLEGTISKVEDGNIFAEFANPNPAVKPGLTAQMRIKLP